MNYLFEVFGTVIYWLLWPFWFLYFKMSPLRSRVLVIHEDKVLLVKGWIGDHKLSLPGGGKNPGESLTACAIRELHEEVGIELQESSLRELGEFVHSKRGLRFKAKYFSVELKEFLEPHKSWPEILDASWYQLSELRGRMLSEDAAFALKHYLPIDQTSLL